MIKESELKSLLRKQQTLYPESKLQDFVKLIFQNEFGGGHLIFNEEDSFIKLREEWANNDPCENRPFDDIGNGFSRLNLSAFSKEDLETINRAFVISSNSITGTVESFEQKLNILKSCIDGTLSLKKEESEHFLKEYKSSGYPPISHSAAYRQAYKPAYRVIRNEFRHYWELFKRIDILMQQRRNVTVSIEGRSASGKSFLGELLRQVYNCSVIHMDHFFLRPEQKTVCRMAETGGNIDYERFREEVADPLKDGQDFSYRRYDCHLQKLTDFISVPVKRLNVIEGVYSMHPKIAGNYDLKVFLNIGSDDQRQRILERDGEDMFRRYENEWIPMENRYFEDMKIKEQCDLIFESFSINISNNRMTYFGSMFE